MKKKNQKDQQKNKKPAQNTSTFIPQQFLSLIQEDTPLICPEERAKDNKKYTKYEKSEKYLSYSLPIR